MNLETSWEFTANTVTTVSGFVGQTATTTANIGQPISGRALAIDTFAAIASGTAISITFTYVSPSNTAGATIHFVADASF